MDDPSQSMKKIWIRFSRGSLFMPLMSKSQISSIFFILFTQQRGYLSRKRRVVSVSADHCRLNGNFLYEFFEPIVRYPAKSTMAIVAAARYDLLYAVSAR